MVIWKLGAMGRKKKSSTTTAPPAAAAPKAAPSKTGSKQPLRRSARRANGLPEENPNGCPNNMDPEEEDSQHSEGRGYSSLKGECTTGKEPQLADLPPSTVVHKKFGMITCMPHEIPLDEVTTEQAVQAPQVVQAIPFTRRRTRGSSVQDARLMIEMVLAQEGEVINQLEESDQCEPVSVQHEFHLASSDQTPVNQDTGMPEPLVEEVVQEVGMSEEVPDMYTDGLMVQEVAISWQQENLSSMDVDSDNVRQKDEDLQCPLFIEASSEKLVCMEAEMESQKLVRMDTEMESQKLVRMDTETESQDSDDTPMPVLVKEQVPVIPSEESDSQASSTTDSVQIGRRKSRRIEPKLVSPYANHTQTVNESDASLKGSDEDQARYEGTDEKLTSEDINEMVIGTNSSYASPVKTGLDNLNNGRLQSKSEVKVLESNNSIQQLEESISELGFNQESKEDCPINVPLSSSTNSGKTKEFLSISDVSIKEVQLSPIKSVLTNELEDLFKPHDVKIPFLSPVKTSTDLTESRSANEPAVNREKPVTRRQKIQASITVKTRTKPSLNKSNEEKKPDEKKKPARARKSCSDASSSSKNSGTGKSGDASNSGKNNDASSSEPSGVRSRRPRNGRKTAEAATPAAPEPKPVIETPDASPVHAVVAMVPPTMGSPSVPHSVHDLSMPVKVKSRWRRSSELEMGGVFPFPDELPIPALSIPSPIRESHLPTEKLKPENRCDVKQETVLTGSPSQTENEIVQEGSTDMDVQVEPSDKGDKAVPESVEAGQEKKEEKESADQKTEVDLKMEEKLRNFEVLQENEYRTERMRSKEWRRMVCDCTLTKEEVARGETGCGEDCLNRLLMIECGSRCVLGDLCSNKRFQNLDYGKIEVFKTEKKGYGLRAVEDLPGGTFLMEYVGEVIDNKEFRRRAKEYSKDKNRHYYFMALKSNTIIDATMKGNHSRFINHSCDPNAETQKWTVNGELRIGFFTKRSVTANEEITFDYQFQNYGKEAQKCFCEASNCRGWIGGEPDKDLGKEWGWKERESRGKKKERDKRREDIDLEEEIEKLCASGLKSRAHTLNLCRLMVRAEEPQTRIQVLQLIRDGEQACRRLFLDYHGLSLIWSWMMDTGNSADGFQVKLEILKTLKALPIPNKTMLQDSKVLSLVEKWSQTPPSAAGIIERKDRPSLEEESGSDTGDKAEGSGDSQEGKTNLEKTNSTSAEVIVSNKEEEDIKPKIEYSPSEDSKSTDDGKPPEVTLLEDGKTAEPMLLEGGERASEVSKGSPSDVSTFSEIAVELLKEWSTLKEVFRIPKKERIEQMKEHEREADKNFRNSLNDEGYEDKSGENSYDRQWRDRNRKKRSRDSPEPDRRSRSRYDRQWHDDRHDRWRDVDVRLSKAERRKQFALRVQQEEEEERLRRAAEEHEAEEHRRVEAEMWRQHEEQCRALGLDPVMTAALYQQQRMQDPLHPPQYYDPVTNQWLPYPGDPNYPQGEYPTEFAHPGQFVEGQPPHMIPGFPPRMFAGGALPPGTPVPANAIQANVTGSPAGQPIPTLSAGQAITSTGVPPPLDPSQGVRAPQVPVMFPGQEVPVFHPAEGAQPFVPAMPGDPQLLQQGTTLSPFLPMVPLQLPPKWKSAKDAEGRTYYYHIKTRVSQWEPPVWVPTLPQPPESESSSDTSDDDDDDDSDSSEEEAEEKEEEEEEELDEDEEVEEDEEVPAIQQGLGMAAHHQQHMMSDPDYPTFSPVPSAADERKKRRAGLVQERIISPRREEDRTDKRIYRQNKEKLKRQKEKMRKKENAKKGQRRHHGAKSSLEKPVTVAADTSSDMARRIKDQFRVNMAGVIVQHLNPYRKPDCKSGRITNTEDFKHLARKLTHFVMVKELKHCRNVDDLECNDNVKHKARDFIKKYMAKFGEVYQRPKDED